MMTKRKETGTVAGYDQEVSDSSGGGEEAYFNSATNSKYVKQNTCLLICYTQGMYDRQ